MWGGASVSSPVKWGEGSCPARCPMQDEGGLTPLGIWDSSLLTREETAPWPRARQLSGGRARGEPETASFFNHLSIEVLKPLPGVRWS